MKDLAVLAALLASALASPLAAQGVEGRFSLDPAQCGNDLYDGRVTVAEGAIAFYESRCDLRNPVPVRGMEGATLFDMRCRGEGETWTSRVLLAPLVDGGRVRLEAGTVSLYARCP